jgi:hypothetical protein
LLERYPETDITPLATSYLKQMAQGRKLESGATNMRGMLWDIRLTNDSMQGADAGPIEFDLSTDAPQLLILTYPTDTVSANQLLFDIARHNFASFVVKDFELEQMNFGQLGLLIIKGFDNMEELSHYRKVMKANAGLQLPPQVRPIIISAKNFDTLIKQGRSFEEYFQYVGQQAIDTANEGTVWGEIPVEEISNVVQPAPAPVVIETQEILAPTEDVKQEQIPEENVPVAPAPSSQEQKVVETPKETKPTPQTKLMQQGKTPVKAKTQLPEFPAGSEGDDPLLDTP